MTTPPRQPVNLRLPPDVVAALDAAAADQSRTRTRQVEQYLRRALEADGYLSPARRGK